MPDRSSDFSLTDILLPLTDRKAIRLLTIFGLVVYFYIFFNGFVWDDITYIIKNPELHRFDLITLFGPNTFNSSGYFRPLPAVYFSLLYQLFGEAPFFYHIIQLFLHIACSVLVYRLFRIFFRTPVTFLLSLIFLVHPINVESVAYVGATQSQLYLLFGLSALYLVIRKPVDLKLSVIIHLLLAGAIFTKEVSVLFFALIYLYWIIFKKPVKKIFIALTTIVLSVYFLVRVWILGTVLHRMQMIPISELDLPARLLHIPAVFFYYIKTFVFPRTLAINQIWTISEINLTNFLLPLLASLLFLAGLFSGLFKFFRTDKKILSLYLFFTLWFLSAMAFLLQIFPLDMTVADRWFYLPMVGILGIAGILLNPVKFKLRHYWIFAVIIFLLSVRTVIRTTDWHSPLILYSRDAGKFENYDLENNLGAELAFSGNFYLALPHFLKSVELWPHDTNLYNAGSAYEYLGDLEKAQQFYKESLSIQNDFPNHAQVRLLATEGLAKIFIRQQDYPQANPFLAQAVADYAENGTLWGYYAISQYQSGQYPLALEAAQKAHDMLQNDTTQKLYQIILNRKPLNLKLD